MLWSATPTPFFDDGSLDKPSIKRLVEHHVNLGVSGLFVGGTCGEGGFMSNRQRAELVRLVKKTAGDSLHIAAHVSDTSAARVCENIKSMTDSGADSVIIAPPFLVADFCNRDFLRRYFLEPIETADIPVGIYVRMPMSKMELDLSLWGEITGHPKVKFIKDSSGSEDYRCHFLELKADRPSMTLLTGNEFDVVSWIAKGYDGALAGTGILNAGFIRRALECLADDNRDAANAWQERSNELLYSLFRRDISSWLTGLKYALYKIGLFSSQFSHLIFPLDDDDRRRIDETLEREKEFLH